MAKQVICSECGKTRTIKKNKGSTRCRSCASKHEWKGDPLTEVLCSVLGCGRRLKSCNRRGICYKCWHSNANDVKSKANSYYSRRLENIIKGYARRGANITENDYKNFMEQQFCGICERAFDTLSGKKHLDHCHSSGAYRGALCLQCNTAFGKLGDDFDLVIERLIRYRNSSAK